jgi:hypothetical protein
VKPQIGGRLRSVLLRCLHVNPAERFPNARALETELMAFVAAANIDDPSEFIAQYLKGTRAFSLAFRGRIVAAEVAMGERAMKDGDVPRAMDAFNRVLSLDEQNEHVLYAVRRLGRRSQLRRASLWLGGVGLALGLIAYSVSLLNARRTHATHAAREAPKPAATLAAQNVAPAGDQPTQPDTKTYQALRPSQPLAASATRPRPRPGARKPDDAAPPAPEGSGPRRVVLRPEPANVSISIDGALPRDFGPSFHELDLAPGPHVFKFIGAHECYVDEQVNLDVPPGPGTTVLAHRLRFRPAGLYVVSNIPANVVVDDGTRGRSRSVIQVAQPEDMFATHVVRVSAEGHQEVIREVRLRAGQVETIEVSLEKTAEPLPPG